MPFQIRSFRFPFFTETHTEQPRERISKKGLKYLLFTASGIPLLEVRMMCNETDIGCVIFKTGVKKIL